MRAFLLIGALLGPRKSFAYARVRPPTAFAHQAALALGAALGAAIVKADAAFGSFLLLGFLRLFLFGFRTAAFGQRNARKRCAAERKNESGSDQGEACAMHVEWLQSTSLAIIRIEMRP